MNLPIFSLDTNNTNCEQSSDAGTTMDFSSCEQLYDELNANYRIMNNSREMYMESAISVPPPMLAYACKNFNLLKKYILDNYNTYSCGNNNEMCLLIEEKFDGERVTCIVSQSDEAKANTYQFFSKTSKRINVNMENDFYNFDIKLSQGIRKIVLDGELMFTEAGNLVDFEYKHNDNSKLGNCIGMSQSDNIHVSSKQLIETHFQKPIVDGLVNICDTGRRTNLKRFFVIFDLRSINDIAIIDLSLTDRHKLLNLKISLDHDDAATAQSLAVIKNVSIGMNSLTDMQSILDLLKFAFQIVTKRRGEGVIIKVAESTYKYGSKRYKDWIKMKALNLLEDKEEFDLFVKNVIKDRNNRYGILVCGYYKDNGAFVEVCKVSGGLKDKDYNFINLNVNESSGSLSNGRIVAVVVGDCLTRCRKSIRHPKFLRFALEKDSIDSTRFA